MTRQEEAKDKRQKKIFNSSLAQFNADMDAQNNCCAVCERPFVVGANPNRVFTKAFYIPFRDHDHRCCPRRLHIYCGLCNRGLLCYICNKFVVGIMEKHCIPVERLASYMTKWASIKPREHPRARAKRKKKK